MYKSYFKRLFDFTIALLGFILISPIFLLVTFGLYIANQGKPFFFQIRPGKNERLFKIIKFKTMNDKKDKEGNLLPDAQRLTQIGRFVSKTSLDEIPQLLNCHNIYDDEQKRRHEVRPDRLPWKYLWE